MARGLSYSIEVLDSKHYCVQLIGPVTASLSLTYLTELLWLKSEWWENTVWCLEHLGERAKQKKNVFIYIYLFTSLLPCYSPPRSLISPIHPELIRFLGATWKGDKKKTLVFVEEANGKPVLLVSLSGIHHGWGCHSLVVIQWHIIILVPKQFTLFSSSPFFHHNKFTCILG